MYFILHILADTSHTTVCMTQAAAVEQLRFAKETSTSVRLCFSLHVCVDRCSQQETLVQLMFDPI